MNVRDRWISVCLLSLLLVMGLTAVPAVADGLYLSVQPATKTVNQGQAFSLDVAIVDVTDLYAFQFDLGFDPSVLSVTNVWEGPFLPTGGATSFIPGIIDNGGGTVTYNADVLDGAVSGVTGSGVLMSFDFGTVAAGTSQISIFNVTLLDSNLAGIDAGTVDGSVTVNPATIPEPSSLLLVLGGLGGLVARRRITI